MFIYTSSWSGRQTLPTFVESSPPYSLNGRRSFLISLANPIRRPYFLCSDSPPQLIPPMQSLCAFKYSPPDLTAELSPAHFVNFPPSPLRQNGSTPLPQRIPVHPQNQGCGSFEFVVPDIFLRLWPRRFWAPPPSPFLLHSPPFSKLGQLSQYTRI